MFSSVVVSMLSTGSCVLLVMAPSSSFASILCLGQAKIPADFGRATATLLKDQFESAVLFYYLVRILVARPVVSGSPPAVWTV